MKSWRAAAAAGFLGLAMAASIIWSAWAILVWLAFGFSMQDRWRVRCQICDGSGLCRARHIPNEGRGPHFCCGPCSENPVWISSDGVPRSYEKFSNMALGVAHRRVLIGCGWIPGNLWVRLWFGGPRQKLGV